MQNRHARPHAKTARQVFPIYPILFGVYPVLALAAVNIAQIDFAMTYRVFVFSLVMTGALYIALGLVMRNWMRAALLTLFLMILFFSYGHVYNILKNPANPFLLLVRHRILGTIWLGLAGLSIWFTTRQWIHLAPVTLVLNIMVVVLLLFPVFQIFQFEENNLRSRAAARSAESSPAVQQASGSDPDIYYIILDAYMRADNIKVVYGYDNTAFIDALTQRGFYVATCSQSNYAYTELSLASSLNMNYLDKLGAANDYQADTLIRDNSVRQFLKNHGYTIVAFETGFLWSQWEDADVYYKFSDHPNQLNSFETLFLQTTVFRIPLDEMGNTKISASVLQHDRTLADLHILKNVPVGVKGPKFVFVHLIIPHPPYVYEPNGDYVPEGPSAGIYIYNLTTPSSDKPGYTNAIQFINSAILKDVDQILADSRIPPIIIIQGDHGAFRYDSPQQRMSILNAYYFPSASARASLYPDITPVNTFRILFDSYFGANLPLLANVSWYSSIMKNAPLITNRWSFTSIPNQCK